MAKAAAPHPSFSESRGRACPGYVTQPGPLSLPAPVAPVLLEAHFVVLPKIMSYVHVCCNVVPKRLRRVSLQHSHEGEKEAVCVN